jgi:phosphohistidine phosphatase
MQRLLLVMRHGKSLRGPEFPTDHERPLAERGQRDAPRVAKLMQQQGVAPDLIVSSSAERALTTARLVQEELGDVELQLEPVIYSSSVSDLLEVVCRLPDAAQCVLLVGHNPGLEELVDELTGRDDTVLKTCSVAVLDVSAASWEEVVPGSAKLKALMYPRELGE